MKSHITIENLDHLPVNEQILIRATFEFGLGAKASFKTVCEEVERWAKRRGWFYYQGGSHGALHRKNGDPRRVVFITPVGSAG